MFYTRPSKAIRRDYSISTDCMDRRLTFRLDPDTTKCLELTYAATVASGLYPFKDKSSFLRWCVHEKYREIVQDGKVCKTIPPVYFGSSHANK